MLYFPNNEYYRILGLTSQYFQPLSMVGCHKKILPTNGESESPAVKTHQRLGTIDRR